MPQRMRMQQQRAIFIVLVVASCYVVPAFAAEALLKRRTATPQLPEDHFLLRRNPDAGAHTPEQIHVAYTAPGAVTVSWVTWPQDDNHIYPSLTNRHSSTNDPSQQLLDTTITASRKLQFKNLDILRRHRSDDDIHHHCQTLYQSDIQSTVQWGTSPHRYSHSVNGSFDCYSTTAFNSGALHHVVLGEDVPLPHSTAIYYRVGDISRDVWSEQHSFTTAPLIGTNALPYRLGLLGDLGQTENSVSTLAHLQAQNAHSVMFVGDLSYADGYQPRWDSWGRMVSSHTSNTVWMFTEGNHEIEPSNRGGGTPDFLAYTKRFRVPTDDSKSPLYYSYNIAGAHIIMLGSYAPYERDSLQYEWLLRDVAAIDRSKTPWVIVGMHAPWYNSNHNHYGEGDAMRDAMEDLLYEHGIDAVVSGHVHAYERSLPTYDEEPDACGPVYINVGDGGNREGLDFDYYKQPKWSAYREPSYGHGILDLVNSTHAVFSWHRNQDGAEEVADEAVLVRNKECRSGGKERLKMLKRRRGALRK